MKSIFILLCLMIWINAVIAFSNNTADIMSKEALLAYREDMHSRFIQTHGLQFNCIEKKINDTLAASRTKEIEFDFAIEQDFAPSIIIGAFCKHYHVTYDRCEYTLKLDVKKTPAIVITAGRDSMTMRCENQFIGGGYVHNICNAIYEKVYDTEESFVNEFTPFTEWHSGTPFCVSA